VRKSTLVTEEFATNFPARRTLQLRLNAPGDLGKFRLPTGVQHRLNELLDRQDHGIALTLAERREAEGLVELAELISLLKLRSAGAQAAAA
jgi:hypothetical protein